MTWLNRGLWALAEIGTKEALEYLEKALSSSDKNLCRFATKAALNMSGGKCLAFLKKASQHREPRSENGGD